MDGLPVNHLTIYDGRLYNLPYDNETGELYVVYNKKNDKYLNLNDATFINVNPESRSTNLGSISNILTNTILEATIFLNKEDVNDVIDYITYINNNIYKKSRRYTGKLELKQIREICSKHYFFDINGMFVPSIKQLWCENNTKIHTIKDIYEGGLIELEDLYNTEFYGMEFIENKFNDLKLFCRDFHHKALMDLTTIKI